VNFRDGKSLVIQLAPDRQTLGELGRFVLIGVKSNIIYFVIYVSLTLLGVDHRIALTVVYVFGILYMFVFNKHFVFKKKDGANLPQFGRHILVYSGIWVVNIAVLQVLAIHFRISPYIVQLLFMAIMAVAIFIFSKYFIFGGNERTVARVNSSD